MVFTEERDRIGSEAAGCHFSDIAAQDERAGEADPARRDRKRQPHGASTFITGAATLSEGGWDSPLWGLLLASELPCGAGEAGGTIIAVPKRDGSL